MKLVFSTKDNYRNYAKIYDELKGDRSDKVRLLLDVIAKYRPGSRRVIELACGTGTILNGLVGLYDVTGLDISKQMLHQAQKRLPHVPLILADMADFQLSDMFDVAYCFHNSVNHLLTFEKWKAFFNTVSRHLNDGGLFIFDVNPAEKLERHIAAGPNTHRGEKFLVTTYITRHEMHPARYYWFMDIVRKPHTTLGNSKVKRTIVTVDAYPDNQIQTALRKHFRILESFTLDQSQAEKPDDIGRTYYICQKL